GEDPSLEFHRLQPISNQVIMPVYFERGGSRDPNYISHEILLSDALAASHDRAEKRKAGTASSSAISRASITVPAPDTTLAVHRSMSPFLFLIFYAPFLSASTTSYGPSHFGPSFPLSFAWLASLLRHVNSPGLKAVLWTLALYYFSIFGLLFASAFSRFSSIISRFSSKASLFETWSTSANHREGIPISTSIMAYVP
ncbi:hypothetical protein Tco_1007498, partial [Tanacetum coccineum]